MTVDPDLQVFQAHRADLVALAYRMLGDAARAEDMVQEAWLRWCDRDREREVDAPRAYLVTIVARLCLNELDSARARREESRGDRLPEPVALEQVGIDQLEQLDQVSMALLVVLQRLKPAERAVLLLHDVFDVAHDQIAQLVGKTAPACRKLLERARQHVAEERALLQASREEHERLLHAFLLAATSGDVASLVQLLSDDAVMISDGGPEGVSVGQFRNLPRPLQGASRIATFVVQATLRGAPMLHLEARELNGRPAIVLFRGGKPFAALLVAVGGGMIRRVFFHADAGRLRFLGPSRSSAH